MKKLMLIIGVLIFIFLSLILFKNKIGNIRQAVLPSKPIEVVQPSAGTSTPYASNLGGSPRDLELTPGGTLLASLMNQGKVVAVSGINNVKVILEGLNRPHGLAFYNGKLYVAEETKVVRYNWDEKSLTAKLDRVLFDLPRGGRHFTRTIVFDKSGKMFISIGSTCDTCFEKDPRNGSVMVSDRDGTSPRIFARGLRNAVFITVNPATDELWGTEMGRDFAGDDLPPDELDIIKDGRDYGWPVCYGDRVYDDKFKQKTADYCKNTEIPLYKIQAHSAPLGLAFHGDYLYVAYHGSWNRSTPVGYKIVRFKVDGNAVSNEEDFITGGRPVDIAFNQAGEMFFSDDKNNVIYKVSTK